MNSVVHISYNLVLSLWIGGISIFTFIVTPVIFKSFSRDMAGKIVGEIFPGYFWYLLALSVIALILIVASSSDFPRSGYRWSMILIVTALAINIFVAFKLHPEIKQVKQEIHSFESLPEDGPLRKKFGKLHAVSAVLNLFLLADGTALLVIGSILRK